jgi:hypothetical protein
LCQAIKLASEAWRQLLVSERCSQCLADLLKDCAAEKCVNVARVSHEKTPARTPVDLSSRTETAAFGYLSRALLEQRANALAISDARLF